jgi:hypothetical protein
MATQIRHAEYDFCPRQAHGRGLCPFCNAWHRDTDGGPITGECVGIYVRVRQAAFVVRGIPNTRAGVLGGDRVTPGGRNLQRAVEAAVQEHASA